MINTLAKIRKPARGQSIYAEDYAALEPLLPLAQEYSVAIVVVYHLRKAAAADPLDEISSSTGLTAGVDGFMILRRTPGSKGPTLYVDGRDIEEPAEYALTWNENTATWTIEGEAEEVHMSKERADILLVLNRAGEHMTPKQVTDALGPHAKHPNVKYLMWTMLGDGQLVKNGKGAYYPANPTNPTNPTPDPSEGLAADPEPTNLTLPHRNGDNGNSVSGVSGDSALDKRDVDPGGGVSAQEPTDDWRSHQLACECAECLAPMPSGYAQSPEGRVSGAAVYLHVRALGLRLALAERPEDTRGYVIRAYDLGRLAPGERERARRLRRGEAARWPCAALQSATGRLAR